ncbi:hypothetical protein [Christiangramia echinicola]|uniref:hypothetical protein n=1 Tax=Christiangramia echinicola TaxID=279359 RepID=UPI00041B054D|nr:hypothetical protein [Christiangramia echinicola]
MKIKKKLFIITLLLAGICSNGQSLEETTDWIIKQYNQYERTINIDNNLLIEEGILFYKMTLWDNNGFWHQFHLKDVKEIEITKEFYDSEEKIAWTNIYFYFDPYKSKIKEFDETESLSEYNISDTPGCYVILNSQFWEDGMAPQMEEALIRLIEFSGGSAVVIKEPY